LVHRAKQSGDGGLVCGDRIEIAHPVILPAKPSGLQFCSLFVLIAIDRFSQGVTMPDIEYIRAEIERMRMQVHRQRGEIRQLQRTGISTASAEALLDRMLNNIDGLCAERDRLKKEQPGPVKGKVLGGRRW
jgi:hypothetical protein